MVVAILVLVLVVFLVIRKRRHKGRVKVGTEALSEVLGTRLPYSGPRWRVSDRWL